MKKSKKNKKSWTKKQLCIIVIIALAALAIGFIVPNAVKNSYQENGDLKGELFSVGSDNYDPTPDPCEPNCEGKGCGGDGCGGSCGDCTDCVSVCKNGNCVSVSSNDYIRCGAGCCVKAKEFCCNNEVCCAKETSECVSDWGTSFCDKIVCPLGKKKCSATIGSSTICCPEEDTCGTEGLGYKPICIRDCNGEGEHKCGDICCDENEKCVSKKLGTVHFCSAKKCGEDKELCHGSGDFSYYDICCSAGEDCFHHPNGYPKCN